MYINYHNIYFDIMASTSSNTGTTASAYTKMIVNDWDDREFIEVIQLNVLQMTKFLNEFDMSMRYKLGNLNNKLTKLERSIEYCEGCIKNSETTNS